MKLFIDEFVFNWSSSTFNGRASARLVFVDDRDDRDGAHTIIAILVIEITICGADGAVITVL